ncbi:MAG TPA: MogA/MoaB family molybdenum cofactor biosynthesis protein [Terriglobales bacterium]|nr:MogA/MoaB family molybdenum cofactor biosynthesis protein [Terriglobales bacterium]
MELETKAAAILTISDSASAGTRPDLSGPAVKELLQQNHFLVEQIETVADEQPEIEAALRRLASLAPLVITTGGTGIATRDVTPEATRAVCKKLVEGIPERMRSEGAKKTPLAALSRGVCGVCGTSLIVNLPGSPKAAVESLQAVIEILPHALELLRGNTSHTC